MEVSTVASPGHRFMELSQYPESVKLPEEGEGQAQNPPTPATTVTNEIPMNIPIQLRNGLARCARPPTRPAK